MKTAAALVLAVIIFSAADEVVCQLQFSPYATVYWQTTGCMEEIILPHGIATQASGIPMRTAGTLMALYGRQCPAPPALARYYRVACENGVMSDHYSIPGR